MQITPPIRITRAGSLGRAGFEACGTEIIVVTTHPSTIARAALAVRRELTPMDTAGGAQRARGADRLAAQAARVAGCGVLVGLGRDLATAGPPPDGGWRVRITDGGPVEPLAVRLDHGGLATVASTEPASRWRRVTVAARSCRLARATAAAAVDRGDDAPDWVASLGCPARLVGADGSVRVAGWWPSPQVAA
jgi:hypothetical protein